MIPYDMYSCIKTCVGVKGRCHAPNVFGTVDMEKVSR